MQAAGRRFVMGGVALAGASLIAVTPIASPPDLHRVSDAAVRLTTTGIDLLAGLGDLGGLLDSGSPLNIPYDLFINTLNIPYYESLALQEYAYALGPAGSVGGVPDWIPPGATIADHGVDPSTGEYALGGTGSWWEESMGNTWGWDNGNYPQVDGLIHFLLPFQFTESLDQTIQSFAQSAFIDGSGVNCEFECADVVGYLGGWLTHLGNVFSSTYPVTQTDTIGQNVGSVINVGPPGTEDTAIWSDQPNTLNVLAPLEALWNNITQSPEQDLLMPIDFTGVLDNLGKLGSDFLNDFNPLIDGSFVYWGASNLYTIPALIGGLIHTFTLGLIPNEFANTAIGWLPNGAEPVSGYTDGPAQLLPNLADGVRVPGEGSAQLPGPQHIPPRCIRGGRQRTSPDLTALLDPASASALPADLLGSFDPSTLSTDLLGSFDPSTLSTDLLAAFDPTTLATDLSTLLSNEATNAGATLAPDLVQNLLASL